MNNIIFGSGIVGLLARIILGDSWTVIPFYKSRFFSFNPALDDNFIIADDKIDPFIKDFVPDIVPKKFIYSRAWSINGQLVKEWDEALCQAWLFKIFGVNIPPQAEPYMKTRMNLNVYDIRINQWYMNLQQLYLEELKAEAQKGKVTEVGDHYFIRDNVRHDFDNAVNTIPLNVMLELMGKTLDLPSKNVYYFHIETDSLDFEGMNQAMVVDNIFSFYKVTNVSPRRYLIYANEDIPNPGAYFMPIINNLEILDGTTLEGVIPIGPMPKLNTLEKDGVFSVGSYAQWDWCSDVGSNILRLLNYASRDHKPQSGLRMI